jgi:hypothetical protein
VGGVLAAAVATGAALIVSLAVTTSSGNERPLETMRFLRGAGARLLVMHDTAMTVANAPADAAFCRARAEALQAELGPDEAFALMTQVPDHAVQDALALERPALGQYLTACVGGGRADPAELRDAAFRVDQALSELETDR